jgi:hypothetical protein
VQYNQESRRLQYALANYARELGWKEVEVIDSDLGMSAGIGVIVCYDAWHLAPINRSINRSINRNLSILLQCSNCRDQKRKLFFAFYR